MEDTNMKEVVEEIKSATEDELKDVLVKMLTNTRTQGMKIGAQYISSAIFSVMQKHIKKNTGAKPSLRDYQRCVEGIAEIISVQLTQQNDSEESVTEEAANDE